MTGNEILVLSVLSLQWMFELLKCLVLPGLHQTNYSRNCSSDYLFICVRNSSGKYEHVWKAEGTRCAGLSGICDVAWHLLMSRLTAGTSEAIKVNDSGAKRTATEEGAGVIFYGFHLCLALMKREYWARRRHDGWCSWACHLSVRAAT